MADVSLDDYMKKKANFRVQISNPNAQRNNQRFNQGGKSQIKNRLGLQKKSFPKVQIGNISAGNSQIKNRLGKKGFQTKQVLQTQHGLQTNKNSEVQMSVTLQGTNRITFDARDKIATNKKPKDAREKLNQGRGTKFKDGKIQITQNPADARVKLNQGRQTTNNKFKETKIQITNSAAVTQQKNPDNLVKMYNQGIGGNTNNLVRTIDNNNISEPNYGAPGATRMAETGQSPPMRFNITRTINSAASPRNQMMNPPPIVHYQPDSYQDNSIPSYNPVHHNIPTQTFYHSVQTQPMYQDLTVMRVNQDIPPVHMMNQTVPVQQYTENFSRTNTMPSNYQNIPVQRFKTGQYSHQESYDDEDDEYYDVDDSLQYNAPIPKQNIMEKTLTVKKPVKITKTVVKEKTPVVTAVKRKAPGSVGGGGGPLKLYKPPPQESSPPKRVKTSVRPVVTADSLDDDCPVEQADDSVNMLSPLQGYKVLVSNLHPIVTQDDIIELFGAIGPMKKARLPKPGLAEIVYVQKDSALKAVEKYNNRELDGQPMQVKVLSSTVAPVKQPVFDSLMLDQPSGEPLKLGKDAPRKDSNVDVSLLHKALFKTSSSGVTKPVTFTVKI